MADSGSANTPAATAAGHARTPAAEAWRRFSRDRVAVGCLGVLVLYGAAALTAAGVEWLGPDPAWFALTVSELGHAVPESATPPSGEHWTRWLGTTSAGKSVLLRIFHGTKVAVLVGVMGAGLSVLVGTALGLVAGFFGGWIDGVVQYVYSTVASIPYLLLMLAVAFLVRQGPVAAWYHDSWMSDLLSLGLFNIVVIIGLTSWVTLCRLVRAEVKKVRELEYVQAARALGVRWPRILLRHVLPNVAHLVIINFSLRFVTAIKSEVILTFLGVGVDKEPSWGQMIADAKNELMRGIWWPLAASGLALFCLTLAVNLVGDALRDALDPRLKK
jgi:peptide/nickel transport system permease protein